jgi:hypothetical protein
MCLLGIVVIIFFIIVLIGVLSKSNPTVDDPTGEKKEKIFTTLSKAIEDIKSTV